MPPRRRNRTLTEVLPTKGLTTAQKHKYVRDVLKMHRDDIKALKGAGFFDDFAKGFKKGFKKTLGIGSSVIGLFDGKAGKAAGFVNDLIPDDWDEEDSKWAPNPEYANDPILKGTVYGYLAPGDKIYLNYVLEDGQPVVKLTSDKVSPSAMEFDSLEAANDYIMRKNQAAIDTGLKNTAQNKVAAQVVSQQEKLNQEKFLDFKNTSLKDTLFNELKKISELYGGNPSSLKESDVFDANGNVKNSYRGWKAQADKLESQLGKDWLNKHPNRILAQFNINNYGNTRGVTMPTAEEEAQYSTDKSHDILRNARDYKRAGVDAVFNQNATSAAEAARSAGLSGNLNWDKWLEETGGQGEPVEWARLQSGGRISGSRPLTPYQKFVKANFSKAGSIAAVAAMWRARKSKSRR